MELGIDAEPDEPLPPDVLPVVARPGELAGLPTAAGTAWDRLLFCAKEAVYKAWSPLTARFLEFDEVAVTLTDDGRFAADVLTGPTVVGGRRLDRFAGRWTRGRGLLVAAVVVPV